MIPNFRPDWTELSFSATVKAGELAYKEGRIRKPRRELDFGIVHNCFNITGLLTYQDMKLCNQEGADLIGEGVTAIDGGFSINPDGELKCFGHPASAEGTRMVAELTKQVLGKAEDYQVKNAKAGFAHNLGGPQAIGSVAIVGTLDWKGSAV